MMTLKTVAYTLLWLVVAALPAYTANAATLRDVRHIVIILKENHTFDNYFGLFRGADGSTTGVHEGRLVPLTQAPVVPASDLPHRRADALRVWDNGLMDDFIYPSAYAQYSESEIPTYWAFARAYVLADNFFTSVMGPSFPNHLFTIFGTSFGAVNNPRHSDGTLSAQWGCDSTPDVTVLMEDGSRHRPCWDDRTVIDEMDDAHVSWKFYGDTKDSYAWTEVASIRHIRYGSDWSNVVPFQRFVRDAASGALPAVSWVTTDFANSEHPPSDVRVGEALTEAMIDAVQNGPDAASTVISRMSRGRTSLLWRRPAPTSASWRWRTSARTRSPGRSARTGGPSPTPSACSSFPTMRLPRSTKGPSPGARPRAPRTRRRFRPRGAPAPGHREGPLCSETEEMAGALNRGKKGEHTTGRGGPPAGRRSEPDVRDLERRLIEKLGTKVEVKGSASKGKIQISYFSADDLERILQILA